jgi:hypothetical protein
MFGHIAKHKFILNYMVWQQHGEVQAAAPTESNRMMMRIEWMI